MGAVTGFARIITTTNIWVARVMNWGVLVLFGLLLWDVFMRYWVGSPISWSQQASKLVFGVYAILGGGYLLARRDHVNVDLFYGNFSKRRKALVDVLTSVLFFALLLVLLPKSYEMASDSVCMGEGHPPWCKWELEQNQPWKAPLWPSKWLIVVAAVLLMLQGIVKLIADIMILAGIEVDETAFGPIDEDDGGKVDV